MFRSLVIGLYFGFISNANAQSAALIDSLSADMYLNEQWESLNNLTHQIDLSQYASADLYYRAAVAAFQTQRHSRCEQLLRLAIPLAKEQSSIDYLLYLSLLQQGKHEFAVGAGASFLKLKPINLLTSASLELGVKYSSQSEPSSLSLIGTSFSSRIGKRFFWKTFLSRNAQNYFWENMQQYNWTFLPKLVLNKNWAVQFPFQLAIYQAKVNFSSILTQPAFISSGKTNQLAWHGGVQLHYAKNYLQSELGFSVLQSALKNDFTITYPSENNYIFQNNQNLTETQIQAHTKVQFSLPWFHERLKPGLTTYWIYFNQVFYVMPVPEISVRLNKRINFYSNYWHKKNFLITQPDAGYIINNSNTNTKRVLASASYLLKLNTKLDFSWFYEWGNDRLYDRSLNYHGAFISFSYFFKP